MNSGEHTERETEKERESARRLQKEGRHMEDQKRCKESMAQRASQWFDSGDATSSNAREIERQEGNSARETTRNRERGAGVGLHAVRMSGSRGLVSMRCA